MIFCTLAIGAGLAVAQPISTQVNDLPPVSDSASALASESRFVDLVDRARGLKAVVDAWIATGAAANENLHGQPDFIAFKGETEELARRDMQAHLLMKERGTDGDLTCILRGISEDLPKKLEAIEKAQGTDARKIALEEMAYLLNDNVEVIMAPPVAS